MSGVLVRLLALACLLIPGLASTAPVAALARQDNPVTITSSSTSVEFPGGVRFRITGESSVAIERVELYYRIAADEDLHIVVPSRSNDSTFEIDRLLDFQANYVPPGVDLTYHWRFVLVDAPYVETDPEVVLWQDTRYDWQSLTSGFLTFFAYEGGQAWLDELMAVGASSLSDLMTRYGVSALEPVRIWVYAHPDDFEAARTTNSRENVAGSAYVQYQVVLAVVSEGEDYELGRVVPHELSHQVLYQIARNPFRTSPVWFDEGLAVYAQLVGQGDMLDQSVKAAQSGELPSIQSMASGFPYDLEPRRLAYAASYTVIEFIMQTWGDAGIASLIDAYSQSVTDDEALEIALGVTYDALDAMWREWLLSQ